MLGIGLKSDGTYATYAPNPVSSSNDTSIATTYWTTQRFATLYSNQTVKSIKTIALPVNNHAIKVQDTGTDNTVKPSSTQWQSMVLAIDKNGKERACCQATLGTDGYSRTKLMAIQQNSSGANVYNSLEIAVKSDGTRDTRITANPPSSANGTEIATCNWVNSKVASSGGSNPTGTIIPFAGSSIPAGYLLCNGAAVSRTTYANLFKVIGTTWGAGDGSTTFKLPDARGRFPEGANGNLGTYHAAGLPNITGTASFGFRNDWTKSASGALSWSNASFQGLCDYPCLVGITLNLKANSSNALYGKATTVQPLSFCTQYLIKY